MLGTDPLGIRALGTSDGTIPPRPPAVTLLEAARLDVVWLVEIDAALAEGLDPNPIYASDRPYATRPDEAPANRVYEPLLTLPPFFERSIPATPEEGVRGRLALGELALANIPPAFGHSYGVGGVDPVDGRRTVVKVGGPRFAYADFVTVFEGAAAGWGAADDRAVRIALRDIGYRLEKPIQNNLYAGTGGLEGGPELEGRPKPLVYGHCQNVTAVLVDPARLIYQLHDGPVWRIPAVYDAGLPLTNGGTVDNVESIEPPPGFYVASHLQGMIRLGDTPVGQVTADVEGDATGNVFAQTTADIAQRVLETRADFAVEVDGGSVIALNTLQPAPVGIAIGTEVRTIAGVLDELLAGISGWWGADRRGRIQFGRVDAPAGAGVLTLSPVEVLDLEMMPPPASVDPANWRRRVAWGRNWTVQTSGLAASVSAERKAFLAEPFRVAENPDPAIRERYFEAKDPPPVPGLFRDKAAAEAEAMRLRQLFGTPRFRFRVVTKLKPALVEPGQIIGLMDTRHGLSPFNPWPAVVLSHRIDADRNRVILEVMV